MLGLVLALFPSESIIAQLVVAGTVWKKLQLADESEVTDLNLGASKTMQWKVVGDLSV